MSPADIKCTTAAVPCTTLLPHAFPRLASTTDAHKFIEMLITPERNRAELEIWQAGNGAAAIWLA